MWYEIHEIDMQRLRAGDLLMRHAKPVTPEMVAEDHNEFFILESMDTEMMRFKRADIIQSSINYSSESFEATDFFKNRFWYCFEKRAV